MTLWLRTTLVALLITGTVGRAVSPMAQLAEPPNDLGVRLGHIHLVVKDVAAQTRFWTDMMGGTLGTNSPLTIIQFTGIFVVLEQGIATAPPAGSVLDHFGFVLKDVDAARARWKAAGVSYTVGDMNPRQSYVNAPDGIRVEVFGDPSLPGPIGMDHIHLFLPSADIPKIQAWYAQVLGGLPGKRKTVARAGVTDCVYFHRFNVSFSSSDTKREATKGRSLEHIGFEVNDIDAFVKRLEGLGISLDSTPHQLANSRVRVASLTDPWGISIELTEGLAMTNGQRTN